MSSSCSAVSLQAMDFPLVIDDCRAVCGINSLDCDNPLINTSESIASTNESTHAGHKRRSKDLSGGTFEERGNSRAEVVCITCSPVHLISPRSSFPGSRGGFSFIGPPLCRLARDIIGPKSVGNFSYRGLVRVAGFCSCFQFQAPKCHVAPCLALQRRDWRLTQESVRDFRLANHATRRGYRQPRGCQHNRLSPHKSPACVPSVVQ